MREFIKVAVELEVAKAKTELRASIPTETRSAPEPVIDIDAIATRAAQLIPVPKNGVDGKDGANGVDGAPGKDGTPGVPGPQGLPSTIPGPQGERGERGADGIATREELESMIESRFADVQVRSLADTYEGVWKEGLHKRGATTTWGGSLWLVMRDSEKKPGDNNDDYKLIVKRGADAKR